MAGHLGIFEQAVLLALAQPRTNLGRQAYGRAVLKEVEQRLQRSVSAGAVYATLDRLERKGLIASRLTAGDVRRAGRPRRQYTIAAKGLRALHASRAATERLWTGVRLPLKGTA